MGRWACLGFSEIARVHLEMKEGQVLKSWGAVLCVRHPRKSSNLWRHPSSQAVDGHRTSTWLSWVRCKTGPRSVCEAWGFRGGFAINERDFRPFCTYANSMDLCWCLVPKCGGTSPVRGALCAPLHCGFWSWVCGCDSVCLYQHLLWNRVNSSLFP